MQLFAKFKKILRRGFRATLNFRCLAVLSLRQPATDKLVITNWSPAFIDDHCMLTKDSHSWDVLNLYFFAAENRPVSSQIAHQMTFVLLVILSIKQF